MLTLYHESIDDYFNWVIDYTAAMREVARVPPKEKAHLNILMHCQALGIKLDSREARAQFLRRDWNEQHIHMYRKILITKGFIFWEQRGKGEDDHLKLEKYLEFYSQLTKSDFKIEFMVSIKNREIEIFG